MLIYHLALASDWTAARSDGEYRVSTLGVSLEQEGFLHCSRQDQWEGVRSRFYADVTEPLVLLVIETDRLTSPLRVDPVGGSGETFPHVYGPLNLDAVSEVLPLT